MEWQPIETAPVGQGGFLLWAQRFGYFSREPLGDWNYHVCHWSFYDRDDGKAYFVSTTSDYDGEEPVDAKYWAPLTPPDGCDASTAR